LKTWSKAELAILRTSFSLPKKTLLEMLPSRTWLAILAKMGQVGKYRRGWSLEECNILKKVYRSHEWSDISLKLPNRTRNSIKLKASKLGISRSKRVIINEQHQTKMAKYGYISRPPWAGKKRPEHSSKMQGRTRNGIVIKYCTICGAKFKSFRSQNIKTCSGKCKNIQHGVSISGVNHHNWNGGSSHMSYGGDFNKVLKSYILNRDSLCVLCKNETNLVVHHVDYNKKNNTEENLVTLCKSCHAKTNFNRKLWLNILIPKGIGVLRKK